MNTHKLLHLAYKQHGSSGQSERQSISLVPPPSNSQLERSIANGVQWSRRTASCVVGILASAPPRLPDVDTAREYDERYGNRSSDCRQRLHSSRVLSTGIYTTIIALTVFSLGALLPFLPLIYQTETECSPERRISCALPSVRWRDHAAICFSRDSCCTAMVFGPGSFHHPWRVGGHHLDVHDESSDAQQLDQRNSLHFEHAYC